MITREEAIARAHEYLGHGRRAQLEVSEGWPKGAYRPFNGAPETVWSVFVASDVTGVGSSHFVVIDAATGKVVSDQWCGE